MRSLIDAALLDQERRILEMTPEQIVRGRWGACRNCEGRLRHNNKSGFCSRQACRKAERKQRRARKG